ncbi:DNA double-strand break repair nuclease NurA [Sulfurisphaera javensis]|uniref:DNA double-strand break repair nuclease NurA n=1 Tax=Sulfurisphaera javensis TaxID=2049879 RepID=A0AAT9GPC4_9CREN
MAENKGFFVLLDEIIQKYVRDYFNLLVSGNEEKINTEIQIGVKEKEIVTEVSPRKYNGSIYAIDGSSRSLISAGGIISISTLAISSHIYPIYGVYPSVFGLPSLPIKKPFIGLASTNPSKGKIEPFIYSSNPYVTSISLTGEPFLSTYEPERIETEIRSVLETEGLKITKDKGLTIIDGPLFPSYVYLPDKVKTILFKERTKIIDNNYIGIVKRLDKSNILVNALRNSQDFQNKYKISPSSFLSDEAFLYQLVRFNYNPPYPNLAVGPLIREVEKVRYYINYLIIPYHKYIPKFSILRIESLNKEAINLVASLPFSVDGIPKILSVADKTAKDLSSGILKYIIYSIDRLGIQESFKSKFEVYNLV